MMILEVIIGLFISYFALFLLSIYLKDNSIADIFWGLAFLQIAIHLIIISKNVLFSNILILILIIFWSLRISFYIFSKKLIKKGEDPRYALWRKEWKNFYLRSFFQVYLLQGFLALIISIPIFLININPVSSLGIVFILGLILAIIGFSFETIADIQLRNFIKNKKSEENRIMKSGLWKYSRHPNYFGESLFWFGVSVMASYVSLLSFVSWVMITLLLRFVSGVPMAEKRYKNDPEFNLYKKKTPPMFPNFFIK